jgi:predicted TIM-barrel fold metal-dependent hydrolase
MRIDFHTHIWSNQEDKVEQFVKTMDDNRIDVAVVAGIAPVTENDQLARIVNRQKGRLIGFASVMPISQTTGAPWPHDPLSELKRAVEDLGLRGLKLHPNIQGFCPTDPSVAPVIEAAIDYDLPILFHTGPSMGRAGRIYNSQLWHFDDLAIRYPEAKIILAHAEILHVGPYLAAKHPNVYLETSGAWPHFCSLIPGIGESVCKTCGAGKVLFGTDMNPEKGFRLVENLQVIESLSVTEEERGQILGENAKKLLSLA